jgi:hypothetical protein
MNHSLPILVYLFSALIVTQIPFLRGYFSLCNTLCHEVIQLVLEGKLAKKITLHNNQSGQIGNFENSRFKHTLITYAAFTGESLAAIGLFYLVSNQNYDSILYLFIGLMVVSVLLWIRNFYGIIWAVSFVVLLALPLYFSYDIAIMHISIFLSAFLLIQSIINGIKICRKSLLQRHTASGILAKVKLFPVMMVGLVLLGQSLYTGYFIAKKIFSLHLG